MEAVLIQTTTPSNSRTAINTTYWTLQGMELFDGVSTLENPLSVIIWTEVKMRITDRWLTFWSPYVLSLLERVSEIFSLAAYVAFVPPLVS